MPRGRPQTQQEQREFENQRNINQWTQLENERNIKQWNELEAFKLRKATDDALAKLARATEARIAAEARATEARIAAEARTTEARIAAEAREARLAEEYRLADEAEARERKNKALVQLETIKEKKKLPWDYYQNSKSYYLSGHGTDSVETFTVPPNCLVFVKAQVGELRYPITDVIKLCKPYIQNLLLTPLLSGYHKIIHEFGSMMIYEPGDQCPNFKYELENCYFKPEERVGQTYKCLNFESGLLDITKIKCDASTFHYRENLPIEASDDDIKQYVESLYINSVYPTIETVRSEITKLFSNNSANRHFFDGLQGDKSSANKVKYLISKLKCTKTNQRELCEKMPGIFYNFICRTIYLGNKVYNKPQVLELGAQMHPRGREEVNDPEARKILNKRIGESVSRAKLLKNYYTSPFYTALKKFSFERNKKNYKLPVRPLVPEKTYNIMPGAIMLKPLNKPPNARFEEKVYKRNNALIARPIPSTTFRRSRPKHWNIQGGRRTRKIRLNKQ